MKVYVYPKFDSYFDVGIRIGGPGLANTLFCFARACIYARNNNLTMLNPTWGKFGLGAYIRNENDKRNYFGLFKPIGISGFKKYLILGGYHIINEPVELDKSITVNHEKSIIVFSGLKRYFVDLYGYNSILKEILINNIKKHHLDNVNHYNFDRSIGIHIRLGDFSTTLRTPISWYINMINLLIERLGTDVKFLIFSDGHNDELKEILSIKNVERVYFGSAISDIIALSKCKIMIGSNSTFSGWGAYLGQVPSIFYHKNFGKIFNDGTCEAILQDINYLPDTLFNKFN